MAAGRATLGGALAPVVAAMLLMVPAAGAQQLPPTSTPLPGSTFQGADGNQTPELGFVDWATLQGEGRVAHSPDPTPDDAFGSGTENGNPGNWHFVSAGAGVSPGSDDILDSWSSVDTPGTNTFLYMAFSRAAGTGTTFLAFELNRDAQLWRNGRGARIPCRRTGDLLITFQPQGNEVSLFVEAWRSLTDDPSTGCGRTGTLSPAVSLTANVDVQGAVNPAAIANALAGVNPIPTNRFGETALNLGRVLASAVGRPCGAFASVWMHSRSSRSVTSAMKDYVAPHALNARRCSASGTKWLDNNANGHQDPGDIGLAGWRIYADLNNNRAYDLGEPFAITDEHGDYVIDDILATGTYTLREEPTSAAGAGPWTCSYPAPACEYTVDAAAEPFARGRNFGNWRPARVTLTKSLFPANDPGQWDLSVGSDTLHFPADGASKTFSLRPGTYAVTEMTVGATDPADYTSTVACRPVTVLAQWLRDDTSTTVTVSSGQHVECTFINVRRGTPAVKIDKAAPASVIHGDTITYRFEVTNPGDVAFAAGDVRVRDRRCDARPRRVEQLDVNGAPDTTTDSLDPGDRWIYECHRATAALEDPDECEPATVTNTGRVTVPGANDSDAAATELTCPPPRLPGIAIQKVGPDTAEAGSVLTYLLYVTNIGQVPFAEADVDVSDPACDAPPELVSRFNAGNGPDTSPGQLDPDDVWVYRCTSTTPNPGAACEPSVVTNTSTVVATSRRQTVQDSDSVNTSLTCPPAPEPPPTPLPGPPPPPPAPVHTESVPPEPEGPTPPLAGVAGRASLAPLRGCLRRGSRVTLTGRRIASVTVEVGGRRVGGLRVRALQSRATIRIVRNLRPGAHRATAVVRFQSGSATPTVRLTRTVEICAPAQLPGVTG